jgi:hypothetical protein
MLESESSRRVLVDRINVQQAWTVLSDTFRVSLFLMHQSSTDVLAILSDTSTPK